MQTWFWEDYLASEADLMGLSEEEKRVFLSRFADITAQLSDTKVAVDIVKISLATFERRLSEVYTKFEPVCPELKSKKKGKFETLRAFLKRQFQQSSDNNALTPPPAPPKHAIPSFPIPRCIWYVIEGRSAWGNLC
jgi:hypothetical protein